MKPKRNEKPRTSSKETPAPAEAKELLLLDEVTKRVRLSGVTLWRLEQRGRFPARIRIGLRRVAWRASDIDAFVAGRWPEPPRAQAA